MYCEAGGRITTPVEFLITSRCELGMVVDILIPLCEGLVSAKERIGRGEGGVYYCLPVLKVANNNSTTLLLLVQQKNRHVNSFHSNFMIS